MTYTAPNVLLLETGDMLLLENGDDLLLFDTYQKPLADGITSLWTNAGNGQQLFYAPLHEPKRYIRE